MAERRWITREEIAEIYEARADKALDKALNGGEPDDVTHVVRFLAEEGSLRATADDIRATERLSSPLGNRAA